MRVLVIDTALGLCSAGAFTVEDGVARPLGLRSEVMTKGHQERLGGLVRDAVAEAGGFGVVDRIGVTAGPGSFTGLRVGLAFAQGLGAALDRPVVGISTLDALAASAGPLPASAALIDARRGQVYARFWRDGEAQGPAEALFADDVAGAAVFALEGPAPEAIARLTAAADPAANPPRPLYLRAPDATPPTRLPGQPRPPAA